MNINTLSHPGLATPSPLPQAGTPVRNAQAPHPFTTLMQYAHHATGGHGSASSHLSAESRGLSAQAAMNHAP